jgi:pimeloyl-ACP methyl ester carboxylesterase
MEYPEHFRRFLALAITHPWPRVGWSLAPQLLRFAYMAALATPVLGPLAIRAGAPRGVLRTAAVRRHGDASVQSFAERLQEPARALASSRLYRTFLTRELLPMLRGRYAQRDYTVPTRIVLGSRDLAIHRRLLEAGPGAPDHLQTRILPGVGHFMVDEHPEEVLTEIRDALETL